MLVVSVVKEKGCSIVSSQMRGPVFVRLYVLTEHSMVPCPWTAFKNCFGLMNHTNHCCLRVTVFSKRDLVWILKATAANTVTGRATQPPCPSQAIYLVHTVDENMRTSRKDSTRPRAFFQIQTALAVYLFIGLYHLWGKKTLSNI